ncbi:MAG: tRNA 2-thiouridine(34) synthase MnmA, partial [Defluviitaleaceae bacterium]|nr:tRNA 2-thiouridine(34) synthase MnmA [Defluviitaleaceae bacterium]
IIGQHNGVANFTIGQRKGLGMAFGKPVFVKEIRADSGVVVLCENEEEIFTSELMIDHVNFMAFSHIQDEMECFGKIRYAHKAALCTISQIGNRVKCRFHAPQRAITPGQSAVFYDSYGYIICGGIII